MLGPTPAPLLRWSYITSWWRTRPRCASWSHHRSTPTESQRPSLIRSSSRCIVGVDASASGTASALNTDGRGDVGPRWEELLYFQVAKCFITLPPDPSPEASSQRDLKAASSSEESARDQRVSVPRPVLLFTLDDITITEQHGQRFSILGLVPSGYLDSSFRKLWTSCVHT